MGCFSFSCAGLGSICENIFGCECGFFSLGALCNCSRTQTIIVPQGNLANLPSLIGKDLKDVIAQLPTEPHLTMSATVKKIKVPLDDEDDQYVNQSIQAIYLIAQYTIARWMKKSHNYADNWVRFESAYRLAGVNLNKHIDARQPLLAKQLKPLNQRIAEIEKYGSLAADLLEKVCRCKGEWEMLQKMPDVSRSVVKFLSKKFIEADFKEPVLFSNLMYTTQAVFIEAVKNCYTKKYVEAHANDFTAWVKPEEEEEKKTAPFDGRHGSPFTVVKDRLDHQFSPGHTFRLTPMGESPVSQQSSPVARTQHHLKFQAVDESSSLLEESTERRKDKPQLVNSHFNFPNPPEPSNLPKMDIIVESVVVSQSSKKSKSDPSASRENSYSEPERTPRASSVPEEEVKSAPETSDALSQPRKTPKQNRIRGNFRGGRRHHNHGGRRRST